MTRLIDADAMIKDIHEFCDWDTVDGITATTVLKQTITDIRNAPTVDAVPVVRCKDCQFCFSPKNNGWSSNTFLCAEGMEARFVGESDFCSWAERKEEDGK